MSSNRRTVRVRGEVRKPLDVERLARAVLAMHVQMQKQNQATNDAGGGRDAEAAGHGGADGAPSDAEKPEASP